MPVPGEEDILGDVPGEEDLAEALGFTDDEAPYPEWMERDLDTGEIP